MIQIDWYKTATAGLAHLGGDNDRGRQRVLNTPMLQAFLNANTFSEPPVIGGTNALRYSCNRMPWFLMMLWRKPLDT